MRFFSAILVYVIIGFVLAWGIGLALKGNFWLLGAGLAAYVISFAKIGCLPSKDH